MYSETGDYEVRNGAIYVKTGIGGYGDIDVPLLNDIDMNGKNIQTVTPTEMAYVHGVTSDIQTQINTKTSYPGTGEQSFLDADHTKLNGIEALADVTDATNVNTAGAVMESDYNAHTILRAIANNTPLALTVGEQTLVGRITGGNITALTPAQIRTLINVADGADVSPWTTVAHETYLTTGTDEIVATGGLTIRDSGTHPLTIENDAGDEATSIIRGMYLEYGGTSSGISRALHFEGSWDYEIYCGGDLKIGMDTNDGTTSVKIWDSDDTKVFEIDSNGTIQGTLAGSEIETTNDCAVAALTIDQNDDDQPFMKFEGVGAADQTKNFSNVNGDGAPSGPLLYSSNPGWIFVGMVRHEMEDTANVMSDQDVWVPLYIPNTS